MTARVVTPSNGDRINRAIAIGHELAAIDRDPLLHRLSRGGWDAACLDMADGLSGVADLRAGWAKVAAMPYLGREAGIRARLWRDQNLDRPSIFHFLDPDRWVGAYAEALKADLTDEQISAFVCWQVAEMSAPETFGALADWSDLDVLVFPLNVELAALDRELGMTVPYRMLEWTAGGACIRHGGYQIAAGQGGCDTIASDFAQAAKLRPSLAEIAA